jgi:hypothetical protein
VTVTSLRAPTTAPGGWQHHPAIMPAFLFPT